MRAWISAHRGPTIAAAVGAIAVIAFGLYWFSPQSALVDRRVDEALPEAQAVPSSQDAPSGSADAGEGHPPEGARVIAGGAFRGIEHETTGTASLVRLSDGGLVLRFEDLSTLNGPDLRVFLSPAAANSDPSAFGDQPLDLGPLKGNLGNQNYALPASADANDFASAVIWCRRFSVGFGVAPLEPA